MVDEGARDIAEGLSTIPPLRKAPTRHTPQLVVATGPLNESDRFQMVRMRPRDGRTSNFLKWQAGVEQLATAHGIQPRHIRQSPPVPKPMATATRAEEARYAAELQELADSRLAAYRSGPY